MRASAQMIFTAGEILVFTQAWNIQTLTFSHQIMGGINTTPVGVGVDVRNYVYVLLYVWLYVCVCVCVCVYVCVCVCLYASVECVWV